MYMLLWYKHVMTSADLMAGASDADDTSRASIH